MGLPRTYGQLVVLAVIKTKPKKRQPTNPESVAVQANIMQESNLNQ